MPNTDTDQAVSVCITFAIPDDLVPTTNTSLGEVSQRTLASHTRITAVRMLPNSLLGDRDIIYVDGFMLKRRKSQFVPQLFVPTFDDLDPQLGLHYEENRPQVIYYYFWQLARKGWYVHDAAFVRHYNIVRKAIPEKPITAPPSLYAMLNEEPVVEKKVEPTPVLPDIILEEKPKPPFVPVQQFATFSEEETSRRLLIPGYFIDENGHRINNLYRSNAGGIVQLNREYSEFRRLPLIAVYSEDFIANLTNSFGNHQINRMFSQILNLLAFYHLRQVPGPISYYTISAILAKDHATIAYHHDRITQHLKAKGEKCIVEFPRSYNNNWYKISTQVISSMEMPLIISLSND